MPPRNPGRHESYNQTPQSGWQPLDRGGAALRRNPWLGGKKNQNPQSGWQKARLFIKKLASPFINGNTIFLQENLQLFLHGIFTVMFPLIHNVVLQQLLYWTH